MRRYELEDEHWDMIANLFKRKSAGRPWRDHRTIVNGILWILFSGAPWRDLPERYGPWQTAHRRFTLWRRDGTWDRAARRVCSCARIRKVCWITPNGTLIPHRFARPSPRQGRKKGIDKDEPAHHALGLSRGGRGTKIHLVTERRGWVLGFVLSAGQRAEAPFFEPVMAEARRRFLAGGFPKDLPATRPTPREKFGDGWRIEASRR